MKPIEACQYLINQFHNFPPNTDVDFENKNKEALLIGACSLMNHELKDKRQYDFDEKLLIFFAESISNYCKNRDCPGCVFIGDDGQCIFHHDNDLPPVVWGLIMRRDEE